MFAVPTWNASKAELTMMSTIEDAGNTIMLMQSYCKKHGDMELKQLTIADAFACLGGNTFSFCENFRGVVAYEKDKARLDKLRLNMQTFRNIRFFGDCTKENGIFDENMHTHVIFLDPPWLIGNVFDDVIDLCKDISAKTTTKYVFMKLPLRLTDKVDNIANFGYLTKKMDDDWTLEIQPLLRWKKNRYEETYTIVCACRKQKPIEDAPAMTPAMTPAPNVQDLLMQLANLHA
jgi:hypothetical protein